MVYPVSFAFVVPIPERGCCDFILLLNFLGRNELAHVGVDFVSFINPENYQPTILL
jgi:hypothetical protein